MTEWLYFHFSLSCIGEGNGNPLQCSCWENPGDGGAWWAAVYGVAQSQRRLKWLSSSSNQKHCSQGVPVILSFKGFGEGNGIPLQYFSWKFPWTEEPGRLQPMGSRRVGHNWVTLLSLFTFMHWRRKWKPTPASLPGESQGRGSLVGCRLWGRTESDTTETP